MNSLLLLVLLCAVVVCSAQTCSGDGDAYYATAMAFKDCADVKAKGACEDWSRVCCETCRPPMPAANAGRGTSGSADAQCACVCCSGNYCTPTSQGGASCSSGSCTDACKTKYPACSGDTGSTRASGTCGSVPALPPASESESCSSTGTITRTSIQPSSAAQLSVAKCSEAYNFVRSGTTVTFTATYTGSDATCNDFHCQIATVGGRSVCTGTVMTNGTPGAFVATAVGDTISATYTIGLQVLTGTFNDMGGDNPLVCSGMGGGAIFGIIVLVLVLVAGAAVAGLFFTKKGPFEPKEGEQLLYVRSDK